MTDTLLYIITALISAAIAAILWRRRVVRWLRVFFVTSSISAVLWSGTPHKFELALVLLVSIPMTIIYSLFRNAVEFLLDMFGFSKRDRSDSVRRGSEIADAKTIAKSLRNRKSRFDIGGVPVPVDLETRSFLFAG